jgi:hypothetical protein
MAVPRENESSQAPMGRWKATLLIPKEEKKT